MELSFECLTIFGHLGALGNTAQTSCGNMPVPRVGDAVHLLAEAPNALPRCRGALIVLIATIDSLAKPSLYSVYVSLSIMLGAASFHVADRGGGVGFAVLQELFSELPSSEAITRLVMASAGFVGTGLLEIIRNRQIAIERGGVRNWSPAAGG